MGNTIESQMEQIEKEINRKEDNDKEKAAKRKIEKQLRMLDKEMGYVFEKNNMITKINNHNNEKFLKHLGESILDDVVKEEIKMLWNSWFNNVPLYQNSNDIDAQDSFLDSLKKEKHKEDVISFFENFFIDIQFSHSDGKYKKKTKRKSKGDKKKKSK
jgi:hypothetical protein